MFGSALSFDERHLFLFDTSVAPSLNVFRGRIKPHDKYLLSVLLAGAAKRSHL